MHELLRNLPAGARVLDLGCGGGSFGPEQSGFTAIRADLELEHGRVPNLVQADAAKLPFRAGSFEAVISNHSLEHFENLSGALEEIRRVLKPSGALYIAVPDASTMTDRLYRWLALGGGHVNPFVSAPELASLVERATGFPHVATRTLCTSLSFLNRKNIRGWPPKRLLALGGGTELSLRLINGLARLSDRILHTRLSVYGWALYFGKVEEPIDARVWTNVCIGCGAGHASDWLRGQGLVEGGLLLRYKCPNCRTMNLFTEDRHYSHLEARGAPSRAQRAVGH